MKKESFESKSWDDLVFENRNKEYGAYSVRKSYSQHMTTGFGFSVALVAFFLILPRILSMLTTGDESILTLPTLKDPIIEVLSPPSITKPETPPPSQTRPPQRASLFTPRVVDTQPTDTILTNDERDEALAQPTGDGPVVDANPGPAVIEAPPAVDPNAVFVSVEEMPEYDGGLQEMMKFISKKIRYPSSAQRTGVEGTVFVSFIVNKEGKVTDVNVVRGISGDCDKEAARVIALLKDWKPGRQNHTAVSVKMVLPIKFQLDR